MKPKKQIKLPEMPKNEAEWCAYRCQLNCKVGRQALEGSTKPPQGVTALECAMFSLLHAVEDLSKQVALK